MEIPKLTLRVLADRLAVVLLDPAAAIPEWAAQANFSSITRTTEELSIVCDENAVPSTINTADRGWRALQVEGELVFTLTGVLASIAGPLAAAQISIFAISTFKSDYVLVKEDQLSHAIAVLQQAGHSVNVP